MRALSQRSDTSSPVRSRSGRPTDPRWAALLIACGALGALLLPSACRALDYVEATPSGAAFPEWDGGDTELCFADLNTDGHVDFVSIGDHGSPYINTDQHGVMVYFGDGQGGWSIHMEGNFGYGGIAVGDVNGDGLLDVGYGMHHNYSGNDLGNQLMEVALGDGTGTAWTPWDDGLATHGEDWGMMATDLADFDNDGDLDIVSGSFGCCNGVHVYRNEGNGSWTQTYALTGGNSDSQLAAGDVNGDGNADFVASYEHGTAFVGDGEGEFVVIDDGLPAAGGLGRPGVALGDIDGDGCADLSFTSGGGVRVYTWRTDRWEDASDGLPSSGDYALTALSDMDVDGHLDVVALGDGNGTVWLGDGAGHWTVGGSFGNGAASSSAALEVGGDVDHNGRPDVALVQREGSWPSDHNKLHVYREGTLATARRITVTVPHGNETLVAGSVRTLRWSAAQLGTVPAAITLELSTGGPGGPWEVIADDIPDSGHHQWTVAGAPGASAHIRATLTQGGESVVDVSAAFRIVPAATTGIASGASGGGDGVTHAAFGAGLELLGNPAVGHAHLRIIDGAGPGPAGDGIAPHAAAAGGNATRTISIFDARGRLVERLRAASSSGAIDWNLRCADGSRVPGGVYWLVLDAPAGVAPVSRSGGGSQVEIDRSRVARLVVVR